MSPTGTRRPATTRRLPHKSAPQPPKRRRISWRVRIIVGCVLVIVAIFAWAIAARALAPRENTSRDRFDVLIVLGSAADSDGNPSPSEQARVSEAVREYELGVAPRMIFTGGAARNQYVEARVMARTARSQGIPTGAVLEEDHAMNTIENACNSLRMMRSHGWESAEVITSPYQLPRAAMIFGRLPIKFRTEEAPPIGPEPGWFTAGMTTLEILKTVHYLVWSRQAEPCSIAGE